MSTTRKTLKFIEKRFDFTLKTHGLTIYKFGIPALYSVRTLDKTRVVFDNNTLANVESFLKGLEFQDDQARRQSI